MTGFQAAKPLGTVVGEGAGRGRFADVLFKL